MSPKQSGLLARLAKAVGVAIAGRVAAKTAAQRLGQPDAPPPEAEPQETDIDPSEREVPQDPQAERVVAVLLVLAGILAFGFTVIYIVLDHNTQLLGLCLGLALLMLAAAAIVAGKMVVPQETHVESRDPLLKEEQVEEVVAMVEAGGEGISRRGLLVGAGGLAGAGLVTALATPAASIGPTLNGAHSTQWHRGRRLVDDEGKPYHADDIHIGSFYTALPEDGESEHLDAGLIVVRLPAEYVHLPPARQSWAPEGILAYSKICPHAACAISTYRYPTYAPTSPNQPALTCPCHYSTFLPGEGGRLLFGPAGRALPQLPLMIDSDGYLRAADGFHEDIGPSWWNVHRGQS